MKKALCCKSTSYRKDLDYNNKNLKISLKYRYIIFNCVFNVRLANDANNKTNNQKFAMSFTKQVILQALL